MTTCCGESYCNCYITSIKQGDKPCPKCGEETFETFLQVKFKKVILSLQVNCLLKERGCGWSGRLEELDAHLDPDQGDCEYADVHCPLNCQQKITRKDITHHIANECVKRDYICPHCSFKATYEIVSGVHWPECSYYPLPCPNRCGVTCERPTMEDHMKICPLEEVECEFQDVGCVGKFRREEEEEHMREKSQAHLTMMAAASTKMKQDFQTKLQEQEKKFEESLALQKEEFERALQVNKEVYDEKLQAKIEEFEEQLQEKEQKLLSQLEARIEDLATTQNLKIEKCENTLFKHYNILFTNFSAARKKCQTWKSSAMYTHLCGYRFCLGIDANGHLDIQGDSVNVDLWSVEGEYDNQLKWPVEARFTIELVNHYPNGENKSATATAMLKKPDEGHVYTNKIFSATTSQCFIKHSELTYNDVTQTHYLKDDTLHFKVCDVTILQ